MKAKLFLLSVVTLTAVLAALIVWHFVDKTPAKYESEGVTQEAELYIGDLMPGESAVIEFGVDAKTGETQLLLKQKGYPERDKTISRLTAERGHIDILREAAGLISQNGKRWGLHTEFIEECRTAYNETSAIEELQALPTDDL